MSKKKHNESTTSVSEHLRKNRKKKAIRLQKRVEADSMPMWDDIVETMNTWRGSIQRSALMLANVRLKAQELKSAKHMESTADIAGDLIKVTQIYNTLDLSLKGKSGRVHHDDTALYVESGTNLHDVIIPQMERITEIFFNIKEAHDDFIKSSVESATAE